MAIEQTYQAIFVGALLALLCVVASLLSRRLGMPLLLVFLVLGMLAGEDGPGGIRFDDFEMAFLFGNLALAVILFDGGLGTRRDTFRVSLKPALSLATLGVLVTAAVTGAAVYLILGLPWREALLIGAIVGSTDAAAVFGLLRNAGLELKERPGATLEVESGSNDPMAIYLTITMVEILSTADRGIGWPIVTEFVRQIGLGALVGVPGGYLLVQLLKRLSLHASLYPLLALAGAGSLFGLTSIIGGSGFLAIYIAGVMVGNSALPYATDIHRFHDGIAWLSQIGMFLMLGLLITPSHLPPIVLPAVAISLVLILVARPVAVLLSLAPFHFPWRERVFIGWCGLRGAVPIILALFPSLAGLEHTRTYFELVFFVVLISLLVQGWTVAPLARWLQVDLPQTLQDPQHLTVKIHDEQGKALLVYQAAPGCRATGVKGKHLPLAEGAQLAGIIRQGILIENAPDQTIKADDQVMVLAAGGTTALGHMFAPGGDAESNLFFGGFALKPEVRLAELEQLYCFQVRNQDRNLTLADYFVKEFHDKAVVGDQVTLGPIKLIVREIDDGRVASIGLRLKRQSPSSGSA